MKKAVSIGLFLVILLASGLCMVVPATSDYLVGDKFLEQNGERYWGPWGTAYTLSGGALIFDNGKPDGWVTINFREPFAADAYRYAMVTLKTDNPADAQEIIMTFGNVKKSFTDWGIQLSDQYTVYTVDLIENGLTTWPNGSQNLPDFALNVAPGKKLTLYVDKIKLTNTPPAE